MQTDQQLPYSTDDGQTEKHSIPDSSCSTEPHFIMMPKLFSEGVTLRFEGPHSRKEYNSTCLYKGGKTFRTSVIFKQQLVPKHFVTVLTVDDEITFYERIEFERNTKMKDFSETVNNFPREMINTYCTNFVYETDYTERYYTERLELLPVQKMSVTAPMQFPSVTDTTCNVTNTCYINEKMLMNGDHNSALLNGSA